MQAVILAGGKGTRLKPFTTVIPKPLMPLGERPILDVVFRQLKAYGFEEAVLAVGYMNQFFVAMFGERTEQGLKLRYSVEKEPLGTAGPLSALIDELDDDFLVMNGDVLTTLNYCKLVGFHKENGAAATISTYAREVNIDFGVIEFDTSEFKMTNYVEKPTYNFNVSMGVNVINKKIAVKYLKPGKHLDIPDLMKQMKTDGHKILCYHQPCFWLDIGRVDDYSMALDIFESRKAEFLPE